MKPMLIVAALFVLSSVIFAQNTAPPPLSKEYIDLLGVRLRLGMARADVADKLAGNKVTRLSDDSWSVGAQLGLNYVHFKEGKLDFVSKSWTPSESDRDVVGALFGAVGELNQQGIAACMLSTDVPPSARGASERVWIACRNKSIMLTRTEHKGEILGEVAEHLGVLHDVTK